MAVRKVLNLHKRVVLIPANNFGDSKATGSKVTNNWTGSGICHHQQVHPGVIVRLLPWLNQEKLGSSATEVWGLELIDPAMLFLVRVCL